MNEYRGKRWGPSPRPFSIKNQQPTSTLSIPKHTPTPTHQGSSPFLSLFSFKSVCVSVLVPSCFTRRVVCMCSLLPRIVVDLLLLLPLPFLYFYWLFACHSPGSHQDPSPYGTFLYTTLQSCCLPPSLPPLRLNHAKSQKSA